jgi:hypothetical protein
MHIQDLKTDEQKRQLWNSLDSEQRRVLCAVYDDGKRSRCAIVSAFVRVPDCYVAAVLGVKV